MRTYAVIAAILLLAVGCGSDSPADQGVPASAAVPLPTEPPGAPSEMCGGSDTPAKVDTMWLETSDGAAIETAVVGTGGDVALFLHQSNLGYCGFLPYATWLETQGVRSILVSLCTYGESVCPQGLGPMNSLDGTVAAAIDLANTSGADRVTVVGASMGGTAAVGIGAAYGDDGRIDAIVDLSGPATYGGVDARRSAADVTVPALFAVAPGDQSISVEAMQELARAAVDSEHATFVQGTQGHGWDLLDDGGVYPSQVGSIVLRWIRGQYES